MSKNYTINGNKLNCFITYSDIKTRLFQNYNNQYGYHGYFDIFSDKELTSYECEKIGDLIKKCFNDYDKDIENSENEKQQLISFLEDKINMCDGVIDTTKSDLQETQFTFNCKKALEDTLKENELAKNIFQEILDFVNKGVKE